LVNFRLTFANDLLPVLFVSVLVPTLLFFVRVTFPRDESALKAHTCLLCCPLHPSFPYYFPLCFICFPSAFLHFILFLKHIKTKRQQLNLKVRQMLWLLGRKSKLSLENKTLIYKCILKPIWTYRIQLWGCAKPPNTKIIQRLQ
jgi:hypothetical protein